MEGELQDVLEDGAQPSAQLHGQMAAIHAQLDRMRHLMAQQAEHVAALRQALAVSRDHLCDLHEILQGDTPDAG